MTTWTEQTGSSDTWEVQKPGASTIWDGGATIWDVTGNVETTKWDVSETSYTAVSGGSTTWSPA